MSNIKLCQKGGLETIILTQMTMKDNYQKLL